MSYTTTPNSSNIQICSISQLRNGNDTNIIFYNHHSNPIFTIPKLYPDATSSSNLMHKTLLKISVVFTTFFYVKGITVLSRCQKTSFRFEVEAKKMEIKKRCEDTEGKINSLFIKNQSWRRTLCQWSRLLDVSLNLCVALCGHHLW